MNKRREVRPKEESATSTLPASGFSYKSRAESTSLPCLENKCETRRVYFHAISNAHTVVCPKASAVSTEICSFPTQRFNFLTKQLRCRMMLIRRRGVSPTPG
ncbi:hypothetical protein AVEN_65179-1 [Araneus ventricosus]|uniref:Uncharacterized protein n=1 Tax=Araneus ventricosus TaxID=182803 RepID=A0A4Y2AFL0_ARAVE|nr:hypothetical protein AVEN_65179-1 [Araneus ventricosus]